MELDGHYIATRIVNPQLSELISLMPERKVSKLISGGSHNFHEPSVAQELTTWPLENFRDQIAKCKTYKEFEMAMDELALIYHRFLRHKRKIWSELYTVVLKSMDSWLEEINAYNLTSYFPKGTRMVSVNLRTRKFLVLPAPYVPIKIYHDKNCIQYFITGKMGTKTVKLPRGNEFTFLARKGVMLRPKSKLLEEDTTVKL